MKRVRASTVFVAMAMLAFVGAMVCLRIDEAKNQLSLDTLAAVLFLAVLPVTALAGLATSAVILFWDRSVLRWLELSLSLTFLVLLAQMH
jgi:hypothetical protein